MRLTAGKHMLNQLICCKRYFRLAALLLAGAFIFTTAFTVSAEELPSGTVSAGDFNKVSSGDVLFDLDDNVYKIDLFNNNSRMASSYAINMRSYNTYLYGSGVQTPISDTVYIDLGQNYTGIMYFVLAFNATWNFLNLGTNKPFENIFVDVDWFITVNGKKYYAIDDRLGYANFHVSDDFNYVRYVGIGYEGTISYPTNKTFQTGDVWYDAGRISCSLNTSQARISMYSQLDVDILNNINTAISTVYNQIVNDNHNIYNLISGFSSLMQKQLSTLHIDMDNVYQAIATNLTNNLKTWFATNHTDLTTLHTDNTTFLARFNSFWTDMVNKFTAWFELPPGIDF